MLAGKIAGYIAIVTSMLIYGVSNGSVAVLINEVLVMISSAIGILQHDRKKSTGF